MFTVLVLEDDASVARSVQQLVQRCAGGEALLAPTVAAARRILAERADLGAFVIDEDLPDGSGLAFLALARMTHPQTQAAVYSGKLPHGLPGPAFDPNTHYISKASSPERLTGFIRDAASRVVATPNLVPMTEPRVEHTPLSHEAAPTLMNVLILEDDAGTARALVKIVSQVGTVHLAGTISEAEALLAKGFDWAAMVVDRRLPDGDGLAFLALARRSYPNTPAALFTGFMEDDTVGRAYALRARCLQKDAYGLEQVRYFLRGVLEAHTGEPA
jgi:DNA-binding NtrC family response regulator